MENWKDVPGYEGLYAVSDVGRVKSIERFAQTKGGASRRIGGKMLAIHSNGAGYRHVRLCKNGVLTTLLLHRLILEAFVGPRPDGMEARHRDGIRSNNTLRNLVWGTKKENADDRVKHGTSPVGAKNPKSKIDECDALEIYRRAHAGEAFESIASHYGVSEITVSHIKCGRTWSHVTGEVFKPSRVTVDDVLIEKIAKAKAAGRSLSWIVKELGVSLATAQRHGGLASVSGATERGF